MMIIAYNGNNNNNDNKAYLWIMMLDDVGTYVNTLIIT